MKLELNNHFIDPFLDFRTVHHHNTFAMLCDETIKSDCCHQLHFSKYVSVTSIFIIHTQSLIKKVKWGID